MDEHHGTTEPGAQPPSAYSPPPPAYAAPADDRRPAGRTAPDAPRKKRAVWIVLVVIVVALLACCAASLIAGRLGYSMFTITGTAPEDTVTLVNEAAVQGDAEAFDRYFDTDSVTAAAYESVVAYVKNTADYAEIVGQFGDAEADRILREQVLPRDRFLEQMRAVLNVESIDEGTVPFPSFTVTDSTTSGARAEVTIVSVEDGMEVTYVLGMTKEMYDGDEVWRIKEIRNMAELLDLLTAEG